jgi:ParB-like chromosome segregation protein Spo0J
MRIPLDAIVFDAGTQVRESVSENVVHEYAEAMHGGVVFPPVVLFHDGNRYYMADGFHRGLAAKRNGLGDIDATVTPGTKTDALWFALGANKSNGQRLTASDKKHAILMALKEFPARSSNQLAAQVGCAQTYVSRLREQVSTSVNLPDSEQSRPRVTGKDGKSYPASRHVDTASARHPQYQAVVDAVIAGQQSKDICATLGVSNSMVADVRRELGVGLVDGSRDAIQERQERMRTMASEGYSSRQIAAAVGVSDKHVRATMLRLGVEVPADKAIGKIKRHDSTRILEQIVNDAENLTDGAELINFSDIDRAQLPTWVRSLQVSRDKLGAFIRRLMKEQQTNGEAA